MKKRLMLALTLLVCALLLCSCQEEQRFNVLTTQNGGTSQQSAQNPGADYDPLAEEDDYADDEAYWGGQIEIPVTSAPTNTPTPTMRGEYAGATPVVIDPIDKPTPTKVPELAVNYMDYDATSLGLAFQAPAGWYVSDETKGTYILQNPDGRIDYAATLTLRAEKVTADYSNSQLESQIKSMLEAIRNAGFEDYNPSRTDTRELLGKTGVYANYDGVLNDGRHIAGRVHAVCVDKVLYTIHLTAPYEQWSDYKEKVYDHLRKTLQINK